jgi:hypothetical protein
MKLPAEPERATASAPLVLHLTGESEALPEASSSGLGPVLVAYATPLRVQAEDGVWCVRMPGQQHVRFRSSGTRCARVGQGDGSARSSQGDRASGSLGSAIQQ